MKRGGAGKGNWGVEGEAEGEPLAGAASLEEDPSALQPIEGEPAAEGEEPADQVRILCCTLITVSTFASVHRPPHKRYLLCELCSLCVVQLFLLLLTA